MAALARRPRAQPHVGALRRARQRPLRSRRRRLLVRSDGARPRDRGRRARARALPDPRPLPGRRHAVTYAARHPGAGRISSWSAPTATAGGESRADEEIREANSSSRWGGSGGGRTTPASGDSSCPGSSPAPPELWDAFAELLRRTTSPANAQGFFTTYGRIDVTELAREISVPTLVLHTTRRPARPVRAGPRGSRPPSPGAGSCPSTAPTTSSSPRNPRGTLSAARSRRSSQPEWRDSCAIGPRYRSSEATRRHSRPRRGRTRRCSSSWRARRT